MHVYVLKDWKTCGPIRRHNHLEHSEKCSVIKCKSIDTLKLPYIVKFEVIKRIALMYCNKKNFYDPIYGYRMC